ncbi:MAG: hypothetical protein JNK11_12600 [Alphaproteobacteria bacterium]|nr:hypothetical protein [Alphaproteobacteria bacterium]
MSKNPIYPAFQKLAEHMDKRAAMHEQVAFRAEAKIKEYESIGHRSAIADVRAIVLANQRAAEQFRLRARELRSGKIDKPDRGSGMEKFASGKTLRQRLGM